MSIVLPATLFATLAAAESPDVEARLEEAEAAASALERVLDEGRSAGRAHRPDGDHRPGRKGMRAPQPTTATPGDSPPLPTPSPSRPAREGGPPSSIDDLDHSASDRSPSTP